MRLKRVPERAKMRHSYFVPNFSVVKCSFFRVCDSSVLDAFILKRSQEKDDFFPG